jgi:hypothetical protein
MEVYQNEQSTSDDVPLAHYDYMYHIQDSNVRTPLTSAFFSEQNLQLLVAEIARRTGALLNRNVIVMPNGDFFWYLEQTVRDVANFADVDCALNALNEKVCAHETQVQYLSLRRRELFFKWFIFNDRPRVIAPPMDTHGRRRVERLSTAPIQLLDPKGRYFADWLNKQHIENQ